MLCYTCDVATSFLGARAGRGHWCPADGGKFQTPTEGAKCVHRACLILLQAKGKLCAWCDFSRGNKITFLPVGHSLMEFHLCKFSLEAEDCLQNVLECHKGHVCPFITWKWATCVHGCSDLTAHLPKLFPSLTFHSVFLNDLNHAVTALLSRATVCVCCVAAETRVASTEVRPFFPVITEEGQERAGKHFVAAAVPFPAFSLNFFSSQ